MNISTSAEFATTAANNLKNAEAILNSLLSAVDARYLFAADARGRVIAENSDSRSKYFRPAPVAIELNAWLLYPYFGHGTNRDPGLIQKCIDALEEYQKAYTFAEMFSSDELKPNAQGNDPLMAHLRLHSTTVRGTAYPIQIYRKIKEVLGPFEEHFKAQFGVGPVRAADIAKAILFQMEDNLLFSNEEINEIIARGISCHDQGAAGQAESESLAAEFRKIMEDMGDQWIPTIEQVASRLKSLDPNEWNALAECVGLTEASRSDLKESVEVQDRPIYFLTPEMAFGAQGTAVLDAIFQFFDKEARRDPSLTNRYGDRISNWMEAKIAQLLKGIFPPECVFENAYYPNPDREGHEAETDSIVKWGPILIIIEAKGKKVDPQGFRGADRKLKNTISGNVHDAFVQASRVIRALENNGSITFKEKSTDRKITVSHTELRRVMPISVTLQHLLGIPTRLAVTQRLGLFKGGAYPWCVSIDDLEVITRFAGSPDVFLHYIERRIAHQSCETELNADELDVFGHYLDNRLHPSLYEKRPEMLEHEGPKAIAISGGEERFGPFFTAEWYGFQLPDKVPKLDIPSEVAKILEELRSRPDDGARFIAFALLGLSDGTLQRIDRNLSVIREGPKPTRQIYRTTFAEGQIVVNLMAHASMGEEEFFQNVFIRSRIEHYRARALATVTIGIDLRDRRAFQMAQWLDGEWKYEESMERFLEEDRQSERSIIMPPGSQTVSRNSLCPCGSGRKFKRCCWGRVQIRKGKT